MGKERSVKYPAFVPKDIDGFFGLFIDNLVNIIIIISVCRGVLGFPDDLIYKRILPGIALSLLFGNWFYFYQARVLARKEGRSDVCAMPYGLNTPSVFGFLFLVMLPVHLIAKDPYVTWRVGVAACFINGVIELFGSWFGSHIRRITPRAALLTTLAGIAITFIAMTPTIEMFVHPAIALITISIIVVGYLGKARMPFGIPVGFLAVACGTGLAWIFGLQDRADLTQGLQAVAFNIPQVAIVDLVGGLKQSVVFMAVIVPMAVTNFMGTMQCLESASAAGDSYPTRPTMVVDGIGTILGSCLGSCFPTTVYIGHPGWKAVGARCGYSLLNGVVLSIVCLFGFMAFIHALIPEAAAGAILLYIGLIILTQAFETTPKKHFVAVSIGLVPHLAAWGYVALGSTLGALGVAVTPEIVEKLAISGVYHEGMRILGGGSLLTSMLWVAIIIQTLDHKFIRAVYWTIPAVILAYFGLIHSEELTYLPTTANAQAAYGYLAMIVFFLILHHTHRDQPVAEL